MIKRLCKGFLCAALSASMVFGSVMVGASEKAVLKSSVSAVEEKGSVVNDTVKNLKMAAKASTSRAGDFIYNNPNATVQPALVYNSTTTNAASANLKDPYKYIWGFPDTEEGMIVRIYMPKAGYLYVPFQNFTADGNDVQNGDVRLYSGWNTSGTALTTRYTTYGTLESRTALARGTYTLVIKAPYGKTGVSCIYPYYYTTENIGMSSGTKVVIGNGSNLYQTFKISKYRRHIWIDAHNTNYAYIQKYSGGSWRRVSYDNYFYGSSGKLERAHYALSPGSYRLVMKPYAGSLTQFRYGAKAYSTSYATRKSKAKTLYRKKAYKTNVMTASDAKGKTHYHKIKVSKKRRTRINFVTYQNSGKFRIVVYGKGLRTKTMYVTRSSKGYVKGTLRKGTYYVKITKMTQNTSGRYSFKYAY